MFGVGEIFGLGGAIFVVVEILVREKTGEVLSVLDEKHYVSVLRS